MSTGLRAIRPCNVITLGGNGAEVGKRLCHQIKIQDNFKFTNFAHIDTAADESEFIHEHASLEKTATAERTIVSNRTFTRMRNLLREMLVAIIAVVAERLNWNRRSLSQRVKESCALTGEVEVRPVDQPHAIQRFTFSGTSDEEIVELADEKTLRLRPTLEYEKGEINYWVQMRIGGWLLSETSFEHETEFQIGDVFIRYSE